MTTEEYNNFLDIANKITKYDHRTEDLTHDILLYFLSKPFFETLPAKERVFYFIRAVKNQFQGPSSYFKRDYLRYDFGRMDIVVEPFDEESEPLPSMEFVYDCLNHLDWYEKDLFKLYIREGSITNLHKITKIPLYSLRKSITQSKEFIKLKWTQYRENN